MSYIITEMNDQIAWITINRPEALNAMNPDVISELEEALFLADKIYIMGGQPAQILNVIEVDLPRPRNFVSQKQKREIQNAAVICAISDGIRHIQ